MRYNRAGVATLEFVTGDDVTAEGSPSSSLAKVNYDARLFDPYDPFALKNLAIDASVAASALTISLKTQAGTDPSATDPLIVGFRNATAADGTFDAVKITSALSTVISSGSTGGHTDGNNEFIYVWLLNNAGTAELVWSGSRVFEDNSIQSTTAEGGGGAADDKFTLYSTTARANVPIRLIGRFTSNQATAGTWNSVPSLFQLLTFRQKQERSRILVGTGNGHGSTNTRIRRFVTTHTSIGSAITYTDSATLGATFTINEDGIYSLTYTDAASVESEFGISVNAVSVGTDIDAITASERIALTSDASASGFSECGTTTRLQVGDVVRAHTDGGPDGVAGAETFSIEKISE